MVEVARPLAIVPLSKVAPKSKFAGLLPTEARGHLMTFAALRVEHVVILTAGNEDVRGKRVMFFPHLLDSCIHFGYGVSQRR